eukprot:scaffold168317_cov31-Prasinocladus_malaysianus.AAC.1
MDPDTPCHASIVGWVKGPHPMMPPPSLLLRSLLKVLAHIMPSAWLHLPTARSPHWTCPTCPPPSLGHPLPHQLCRVQWAPA